MADQQSSPNLPANPLCNECRSNPWKYRCPGCSTLTCSLPCVKSHKLRTGCTGQKNRSEIVPLSKFDDNLLLSDYKFLEETKRVTESARRGRYGIGGRFYGLPGNLKVLKDAAHRRKTRVLFLLQGMSRRGRNQSRYERRTNTIFWTIEWRFHSTDVVLIDHGVDEHMSFLSVVEKHLAPSPWNHQLRSFCNEELDNLKFFLQKNKGSKAIFRELNVTEPIGRQMGDVLIVEYPVIHVYLPSDSFTFQVEKIRKPMYANERPPSEANRSLPIPEVTFFREEDINDDGSSETVVVDFLQCTKPEAFCCSRNSMEATGVVESETATTMNERIPEASSQFTVDIASNNNWGTEGNTYIDCDFDFEQDLKDAYSYLMQEADPDGFLCFDDADKGEQVEDKQGTPFISQMEFEEEELEEGEIPSW